MNLSSARVGISSIKCIENLGVNHYFTAQCFLICLIMQTNGYDFMLLKSFRKYVQINPIKLTIKY